MKHCPTRWVWSCLCALMAAACMVALVGSTAAQATGVFAEEAQNTPPPAETPAPTPSPTPAPTPKPMTIYVAEAGGLTELSMEEGTVSDALYLAGIAFDGDDAIMPEAHMLLENGLRIEYADVEITTETETETIAHDTVRREDDDIEKGVEKRSQKGSDGERVHTYRVTTVDGEVTERELVETVVTVEPQDEIIKVGTKIVHDRVSVPALVTLKNDSRENNHLAPKKSEIADTVYVMATAYTHTGNKTATGTWPKVGTIAVNPKQIPYGTKLYVEGYGYGIAADTGGFRHTDRFQIDLFMDTESECIRWGRKRSVKVYILED